MGVQATETAANGRRSSSGCFGLKLSCLAGTGTAFATQRRLLCEAGARCSLTTASFVTVGCFTTAVGGAVGRGAFSVLATRLGAGACGVTMTLAPKIAVANKHRAPASHNRRRWVAKAVPVPLGTTSLKPKRSDEDRQPLAVVSVAWTPAYDPEDVSYGYSETDPDTGQVVRTYLSRKGNSILIRIDSDSETDQPQIKGETNDETIPSA